MSSCTKKLASTNGFEVNEYVSSGGSGSAEFSVNVPGTTFKGSAGEVFNSCKGHRHRGSK